MLFPFRVPPSEVQHEMQEPPRSLLDHLVTRADTLNSLGTQTLRSVRPGQLILHTFERPLSATQTMQLASLARLTHERHFNTRLYKRDELFIPGGLVLGLTHAASA